MGSAASSAKLMLYTARFQLSPPLIDEVPRNRNSHLFGAVKSHIVVVYINGIVPDHTAMSRAAVSTAVCASEQLERSTNSSSNLLPSISADRSHVVGGI